ncbi:NAD(P)-bd-dom domain-containing protein [Favolaschia claudopus]|uniref:NAD(P)-bd-dom domain-containing protein n=1 Tax=Favolaschia claudopus TaxID=2862362 RepID=A0AAW0A9K4_9AGAR
MASLNVLAFGASRNIGYMSAVRLLEKGATVTFLLRTPSAFDEDATIQRFIKSGHVRLVKGDASIEADTQRAWEAAGPQVDAVTFSVGTYPKFHLTKGFVQTPGNMVAQCLVNVLCTMPKHTYRPQPKIVVISSTGLTPSAHEALPTLLKPLYGIVLASPHKDKLAMEWFIARAAGWPWNPETDGKDPETILDDGWMQRQGLPEPGSLKNILVVRPALLTDGKSVADENGKKAYRVSEGELRGYSISRKDVSHFVVDALDRWEEFKNKRVNIAY